MEHFTIIKRLGDGAQGVTQLCVDKRTGAQVVIKKMPSGLRSSEEINVIRKVRHPNIVECLEIFSQDDFVFIVMRYAEGGDLETYLEKMVKEKKAVPIDKINAWIGQLARAVHHCHVSRVMHRDIKPGNIFLSKDASEVYLGDFGVSKMFHGSMDVATTFVGSPIWLSPEVLSGTPYGCMADVWSLGCVFYEIATLRKPFAAPHFAALVLRICSGQYDPLPLTTPPHIAEVIKQMLNIDVNERMMLTEVLNSSELFSRKHTKHHRKGNVSKSCDSVLKSSSQTFEADEEAPIGCANDVETSNSAVDLQDWAKAKLRDISNIEKYLARHRDNDAIVLQRVDEQNQMLKAIGAGITQAELSAVLSGAVAGGLNPERARRMLPSPMKTGGDATESAARGVPLASPPALVGDQPPLCSSPQIPQRWADAPPPPPLAKLVSGGRRPDVSPPQPSAAPPSEVVIGKNRPAEKPVQVNGEKKSAALQPRPASGQPVMAIPDLPSPPSKAQHERREAQRQDIKAMIREQRAKAAASGGAVAVEILLPSNLKNLPQNRV